MISKIGQSAVREHESNPAHQREVVNDVLDSSEVGIAHWGAPYCQHRAS